MMKTKFCSYCSSDIPQGCKYCVKGKKLVLFISGRCSRNCVYCSLSNLRKEQDITYANERKCKSIKDLIEEVKQSRATSAGITGGDPLLFLNRTIKYASVLKKKFGRKFHIHIYLPTKKVTKKNLKKLSKYINEVRFHPEFLINPKAKNFDIEKISLASQFWKKQNMGIELPMIPNKREEILDFIIKIKNKIGFLNLNEFEISDHNFNFVTKNYSLDKSGYTVKKSIPSGKWLIKKLKNYPLKVHLCTAETKNFHQYQNRLREHKAHPFGIRTKEGNVLYFAIYSKNKREIQRIFKELGKDAYFDKKKLRFIILPSSVKKLIKKYPVERVLEFPTFDSIEIERWRV